MEFLIDNDTLNLDSYTPDKLQEIAIAMNIHPRLYANHLFGNKQYKVKAVKLLIAYAWNKSTAMKLRLSGEVNKAQMYEDICEKIYNRLPDYARW